MIALSCDNSLKWLVFPNLYPTVRGSLSIANILMHDLSSAPNPLSPERMTADERLAELGAILATGLRRILPEESSHLSAASRDSSFDILALKRRVGRRKPSNRVGES
jgi:hypothetical protein